MMTTTTATSAEDVTTETATANGVRSDGKSTQRARLVVAGTATFAFAWAIAVSHWLFPFLTNDHDEAVYLLQANALEHGHLFPKAPAHAASFLPWLSVQRGNVFVPKYAPVFASMLTLGKWVFTTERVTLGLIAAAVIVSTYLLATELLPTRTHAALAAVFMAATPLFLIQSATFLPYTASLMLLTMFAFTLFRGVRVGRAIWFVASGLFLGTAFFARPYDAVLFMLPLAGFFIARHFRDLRAFFSRAGWIVLGLVPPAIVMALFDRAATGSATRSPFSLLDPRDTLGFGSRSMDPSNNAVRYTPALGFTGLSRHALLTAFWCFGGLVLIGLMVWFCSSVRFRGPAACYALVAITIPLGYLFFWGTYGAAVWGAPWYLGPFYYMPVFSPIAILGAGGFALLRRNFRGVAIGALVGMIALSGGVLAKAIRENQGFTQDDRRLNSALTSAHLHNALVFLPAFYGPRLLHPFAKAANSWNLTGNVVYAVDLGDSANLAVMADYPNRTPYALKISGQYRASPYDHTLTSTMHELTPAHGRTVEATISLRNPTNLPEMLVTATRDGHADSFVIDNASSAGKAEKVVLRVTDQGVTAVGPVQAHTRKAAARDTVLRFTISAAGPGTAPKELYFHTYGVHVRDHTLYLLPPGLRFLEGVSSDPLTIAVF